MRSEAAGFEKVSHEYERGRPGYPAALVDWIVETAGLAAGKTVVDLAAGTGKLTRELVGSGAHVIAVEPLDEMRARLVELLPEVVARAGSAEATGLDDGVADAVTVAQAFHWFASEEVLAEIARLLRPAGLLFLVWNRRELSDPIQASISRITAPYVGEVPSYANGHWQLAMEATHRFEPLSEHHSGLVQVLDRQGIVDRVASTSYIANLPDEARLPLLDEVAALVPSVGTVALPYVTDAYAYWKR